jgi:hypothetical protein
MNNNRFNAPDVMIQFANWIGTSKDEAQVTAIWDRLYCRGVEMAHDKLGTTRDKLMPYGVIKPGEALIGATKIDDLKMWVAGHAVPDIEFSKVPSLSVLAHGLAFEVDGVWIRKPGYIRMSGRSAFDITKLGNLPYSWLTRILCYEIIPASLADEVIRPALDSLPYGVVKHILG